MQKTVPLLDAKAQLVGFPNNRLWGVGIIDHLPHFSFDYPIFTNLERRVGDFARWDFAMGG